MAFNNKSEAVSNSNAEAIMDIIWKGNLIWKEDDRILECHIGKEHPDLQCPDEYLNLTRQAASWKTSTPMWLLSQSVMDLVEMEQFTLSFNFVERHHPSVVNCQDLVRRLHGLKQVGCIIFNSQELNDERMVFLEFGLAQDRPGYTLRGHVVKDRNAVFMKLAEVVFKSGLSKSGDSMDIFKAVKLVSLVHKRGYNTSTENNNHADPVINIEDETPSVSMDTVQNSNQSGDEISRNLDALDRMLLEVRRNSENDIKHEEKSDGDHLEAEETVPQSSPDVIVLHSSPSKMLIMDLTLSDSEDESNTQANVPIVKLSPGNNSIGSGTTLSIKTEKVEHSKGTGSNNNIDNSLTSSTSCVKMSKDQETATDLTSKETLAVESDSLPMIINTYSLEVDHNKRSGSQEVVHSSEPNHASSLQPKECNEESHSSSLKNNLLEKVVINKNTDKSSNAWRDSKVPATLEPMVDVCESDGNKESDICGNYKQQHSINNNLKETNYPEKPKELITSPTISSDGVLDDTAKEATKVQMSDQQPDFVSYPSLRHISRGLNDTAERFFVCTVEGCTFICEDPSTFRTHLNVAHSDIDVDMTCAYCDFKTKNSDILVKHIQNHGNKLTTIYKCPVKKCTYGSNVPVHFKSHLLGHPKLEVSCANCGIFCVSIDELIEHIQKSIMKLIQCSYCSFSSSTKATTMKHMGEKHREKPRRITVTSRVTCHIKRTCTSERPETPSSGYSSNDGSVLLTNNLPSLSHGMIPIPAEPDVNVSKLKDALIVENETHSHISVDKNQRENVDSDKTHDFTSSLSNLSHATSIPTVPTDVDVSTHNHSLTVENETDSPSADNPGADTNHGKIVDTNKKQDSNLFQTTIPSNQELIDNDVSTHVSALVVEKETHPHPANTSRRTIEAMDTSSKHTHTCSLCSFVTTVGDDSVDDSVDHQKLHSQKQDKSKRFLCKECPYSVDECQAYIKHSKFHPSRKIRYFKCSYCTYMTNQMDSIDDHLDQCHCDEEPKYEVKRIDLTLESKPQLKKTLTCAYCSFTALELMEVKLHVIQKHKENCTEVVWFSCGDCNTSMPTELLILEHGILCHKKKVLVKKVIDFTIGSEAVLNTENDQHHESAEKRGDIDSEKILSENNPDKVSECKASLNTESEPLLNDSKMLQFTGHLETNRLHSRLPPSSNNKSTTKSAFSLPAKGVFQCTICSFTTKVRTNYILHLKLKHNIVVPDPIQMEEPKIVTLEHGWYKCGRRDCEYIAQFPIRVTRHFDAVHKKKHYQCSYCTFSFSDSENLTQHVLINHAALLKTMFDPENYVEKIDTVSEIIDDVCSATVNCDDNSKTNKLSYPENCVVENDSVSEIIDDAYSATVNDDDSKTDEDANNAVGNTLIECSSTAAGRVVNDEDTTLIKETKGANTGEYSNATPSRKAKSYKVAPLSEKHKLSCQLCPYTANAKNSLEFHMVLHSGHTEVVVCPLCGIYLHVSSHFEHFKTFHSETISAKLSESYKVAPPSEKHKISCQLCPYTANATESLENHMVLHSGHTEVVVCHLCGVYLHVSSQSHHVRTYHSETITAIPRELMCSFCTFSCESKNVMEDHEENVHAIGNKSVECTVCGTFLKKSNLTAHYKASHPHWHISNKTQETSNTKVEVITDPLISADNIHTEILSPNSYEPINIKVDPFLEPIEEGLIRQSEMCNIEIDPRLNESETSVTDVIEPSKTNIEDSLNSGSESPCLDDTDDTSTDSRSEWVHQSRKEGTIFTCSLCTYFTDILNSLQRHEDSVHNSNARTITCDLCGVCVVACHIIKHRRTQCTIAKVGLYKREHNTPRKWYKCTLCPYQANGRLSGLNDHIKHCHERNALSPIICDICGIYTATNGSLKRHKTAFCAGVVNKKVQESIKTTETKIIAENHTLKKGVPHTYKCTLCPYTSIFEANVRRHDKTCHYTSMSPFVCNDCGIVLATSGVLVTHKRLYCKLRKRRKKLIRDAIPICVDTKKPALRSSSNRASSRSDVSNDLDDSEKKCAHCPYESDNKWNVIRHEERYHVKDAKKKSDIICEHCGIYVCKMSYKRHLFMKHRRKDTSKLSHKKNIRRKKDISNKKGTAKIKRYECNMCIYSANSYPVLRQHKKKQHYNNRPFFCLHCQYSGRDMINAKAHHKAKHPGKQCKIVLRKNRKTGEDVTRPSFKNTESNACTIHYTKTPDKASNKTSCVMCKCGKVKSSAMFAVRKHIMVQHLKYYPYQCKKCDFKAVQKVHIIKHAVKSHSMRKSQVEFLVKRIKSQEKEIMSYLIFRKKKLYYMCKKCGCCLFNSKNHSCNNSEEIDKEDVGRAVTTKELKCMLNLEDLKNTPESSHSHKKLINDKSSETNSSKNSSEAESNAYTLHYTKSPDKASNNTSRIMCKCGKIKSGQISTVRKHIMAQHLNYYPYQCKQCDFKAVQKNRIIKHAVKSHSKRKNQVDFCVNRIKSQEKEIMSYLIFRKKRPYYMCKKCGCCLLKSKNHTCNNSEEVDKEEVERTVTAKELKCIFCPHLKSHEESMRRHLSRHIGYLPICCRLCLFRTTSKQNLKIHHDVKHRGKKCDPFFNMNDKSEKRLDDLMKKSAELANKPLPNKSKGNKPKSECKSKRKMTKSTELAKNFQSNKVINSTSKFRNKQDSKTKFKLKNTGNIHFKCTYDGKMCGYVCKREDSMRFHLAFHHTKYLPYHCAYCKYKGTIPCRIKSHFMNSHINQELCYEYKKDDEKEAELKELMYLCKRSGSCPKPKNRKFNLDVAGSSSKDAKATMIRPADIKVENVKIMRPSLKIAKVDEIQDISKLLMSYNIKKCSDVGIEDPTESFAVDSPCNSSHASSTFIVIDNILDTDDENTDGENVADSGDEESEKMEVTEEVKENDQLKTFTSPNDGQKSPLINDCKSGTKTTEEINQFKIFTSPNHDKNKQQESSLMIDGHCKSGMSFKLSTEDLELNITTCPPKRRKLSDSDDKHQQLSEAASFSLGNPEQRENAEFWSEQRQKARRQCPSPADSNISDKNSSRPSSRSLRERQSPYNFEHTTLASPGSSYSDRNSSRPSSRSSRERQAPSNSKRTPLASPDSSYSDGNSSRSSSRSARERPDHHSKRKRSPTHEDHRKSWRISESPKLTPPSFHGSSWKESSRDEHSPRGRPHCLYSRSPDYPRIKNGDTYNLQHSVDEKDWKSPDHERSSLGKDQTQKSPGICPYYLNGLCIKGNTCDLRHVEHSVQENRLSRRSSPRLSPRSNRLSPRSTTRDDDCSGIDQNRFNTPAMRNSEGHGQNRPLCFSHSNGRPCLWGDRCKFRHSVQFDHLNENNTSKDTQQPRIARGVHGSPEKSIFTPCKYNMQGYCRKGSHCSYSHTKPYSGLTHEYRPPFTSVEDSEIYMSKERRDDFGY